MCLKVDLYFCKLGSQHIPRFTLKVFFFHCRLEPVQEFLPSLHWIECRWSILDAKLGWIMCDGRARYSNSTFHRTLPYLLHYFQLFPPTDLYILRFITEIKVSIIWQNHYDFHILPVSGLRQYQYCQFWTRWTSQSTTTRPQL